MRAENKSDDSALGCAIVIILALGGAGIGGLFGWAWGCLSVAGLLTFIILMAAA